MAQRSKNTQKKATTRSRPSEKLPRQNSSPCGQYSVCCSEPAVRCLIVHLLCNDELYQRFKKEPRKVLAESGIELPTSVDVDMAAFDRTRLRRIALTAGSLLNITLGGKPILKMRGRPLRRKRAVPPIGGIRG